MQHPDLHRSDPHPSRELNGTITGGINTVWDALTTADGIGAWWATLDAAPAPEAAAADLRPGGSLRAGMRTADYGDLVTVTFDVLEAQKPNLLLLHAADTIDARIQLTLASSDETRTTIRAAISAPEHELTRYLIAWSETLRALRAFIERPRTIPH